MKDTARFILEGRAIAGIELGSTRIKAVLIGDTHQILAAGAFEWENRLVDGVWTYPEQEIVEGLQRAYAALKRNVEENYGVKLTKLKGLGVSAMMHGYIPLDDQGALLTEFRTWRNLMTEEASEKLTALFGFHIPQRWTIAHLYQAILNGEAHLKRLSSLTTLAGYVHARLSGRRVVGIGEASGIFPTDMTTLDYDQRMAAQFDELIAPKGYAWKLRDVLPAVLNAGEDAGCLTPDGALLLDPTGETASGTLMCPPEGDAGTGMTATNSISVRTGNVSAGTSIFSMAVLERPLKALHREIDIVATPTGYPVAMVHCNNCTSDINAWAKLMLEAMEALGLPCDAGTLLTAMFKAAMKGEADCGGVTSVGFCSGEHVVGLEEGRPLMVRLPDASLTFANFSRSLVLSAMATLCIGMRILEDEDVRLDRLIGHGGFFKTPGTAQKLMASALNMPISVMDTAAEGGAWGMALLAAYRVRREADETLDEYLNRRVFNGVSQIMEAPDEAMHEGITRYLRRFEASLAVERAAVEHL